MAKRKGKAKVRADPQKTTGSQNQAVFLCSPDAYDLLVTRGYTRLDQNPEICAGVDVLARLVGSMTIHLMENTDKGDKRIHNELSRLVDIRPNSYMTRSNFVQWIVKTMWLGGNGNAVVWPRTRDGLIEELRPLPPSMVSFCPDGWGYQIVVGGTAYAPDMLLHFVLNPDTERPWLGAGYRVALNDVAHNLKQAAQTKQEFLESKWKPSMIVKVEGLADEFSSRKGREKLLESYISTDKVGTPWLIPAGTVDVKEVRPLSLSDLALADNVQLDKRTAAAVLGIPPFVLGVGKFDKNEWNNFVSTRVMHTAQIIQQSLTRGLLYKPEWYFRMNPRSLYAYSLPELAEIVKDLNAQGLMTGNEGRDWLDLVPMDGLDDLIVLENYLPRSRLGDQKKLKGGAETSNGDS